MKLGIALDAKFSDTGKIYLNCSTSLLGRSVPEHPNVTGCCGRSNGGNEPKVPDAASCMKDMKLLEPAVPQIAPCFLRYWLTSTGFPKPAVHSI